MPPQFVFEMRDVGRTFGEKAVLRTSTFRSSTRAKIGVVGENGSGKSTLLRIMAGLDGDFDGSAALAKGMRMGYVAQEPQLDLDRTVRENLLTAMKLRSIEGGRLDPMAAKFRNIHLQPGFPKQT